MKMNVCYLCHCLLFLMVRYTLGSDRITANQSITGDKTVVSTGGAFEMGFFHPSGNTSNYYIGIWYNLKKVTLQTVVWVANREIPVKDNHAYELKILNGNLVLTNASNSSVWSTNIENTTSTAEPVAAVLEDSGNLVLRGGTNLSQILWQSFDNPSDTWLPGGKIAYNKRKKQKQYLTSWKNVDDPAQGLFSLELQPKGKEYIINWNRSRQYWTSGAWDEQEHIFSLVPEMRLNYIYNFSYVDNENESYFTYSIYDKTIISRFVMDISGQVKMLTWLDNTQQWNLFWSQPRQQCEVYAFCGEFGSCTQNSQPFCNCLKGFKHKSQSEWDLSDYSGGCVRNTPLQCGSTDKNKQKKDRFWVQSDMRTPEHPQSVNASTLNECQSICFNNCSCTAYSFDANGCSIWSESLLNLQQLSDSDTSGKTLYFKLADSEFPKNSNNKLVIGVVVGVVVAIIALSIIAFLIYWRRRSRSLALTKGVEGSLIPFGYRDLQVATKNFSQKLGGGGFGSVFKGTLPDSSVIAVKKLEGFNQGEKQFRSEVSTIGTVQHVNLVRLRGFCSEGTKKLLVYDYMENRSLDSHLFHNKGAKILDWKTRYQVALGISRGLAYLHEKCRDCIIHCDIKPENILLDADLCPKVADFGLAKLVGREFSRVLTTMRGTRGYLAPEWISGVAITAKADVFSYGMMLFEIISGHRNTEQSGDGNVTFFPTSAAQKLAAGGDIMIILDPRLEGNGDREQVVKLTKLACWCIQDDENHRPSMGQVVQILEGVLDVNMPPIPRSLQVFIESQESIMFFTESSSSQSSQTMNNSSTSASQTKSSSSVST